VSKKDSLINAHILESKNMVAEYIESELGISPLAQVQNKETPSLVYAWDSRFFDFVGLKKRGFCST